MLLEEPGAFPLPSQTHIYICSPPDGTASHAFPMGRDRMAAIPSSESQGQVYKTLSDRKKAPNCDFSSASLPFTRSNLYLAMM